jgi:hypothetical protein
MSFYIFRLEKLHVREKRGNIPDDDVVTFGLVINQLDRGHASGLFYSMVPGTTASTDDRVAPENWMLAYPARNRLNSSELWAIGPLETMPGDDVTILYTGTNVSDSNLASLSTQKQDELEIKIADVVFKKFVGLIAGFGFGDDIGSAVSEAFNKAFADPVGWFIGYKRQGPCNGPVFVGAERLHGSDLDQLMVAPLTYTLYPDTPYPKNVVSEYPGIRFTPDTYTDAASHDTDICGQIAQTDITFSVSRVPFISLRHWVPVRFPGANLSSGLRKLGPPAASFSVKSLLGIRP